MVYELFKKFCTDNLVSSPKTRTANNKSYLCYTFTTRQLPCFNLYYDLFYQSNIKVVPKNIDIYLTPLSLAFWIMGDGSKQNEGLHLNTYGFKLEDINILVEALNKNFKINCTLHKHKTGMRIYISKNDLLKIKPLIKPHMHSTMFYKLGIKE